MRGAVERRSKDGARTRAIPHGSARADCLPADIDSRPGRPRSSRSGRPERRIADSMYTSVRWILQKNSTSRGVDTMPLRAMANVSVVPVDPTERSQCAARVVVRQGDRYRHRSDGRGIEGDVRHRPGHGAGLRRRGAWGSACGRAFGCCEGAGWGCRGRRRRRGAAATGAHDQDHRCTEGKARPGHVDLLLIEGWFIVAGGRRLVRPRAPGGFLMSDR